MPQQRPRSLWDLLPIEIKSNIISRCEPVTRYLNNDLPNTEIESHGEEMWKIVLEQDILDFNLNVLPQSEFPNIYYGLGLVKSEQMYKNLCNLRSDLTNTDKLKRYFQNDRLWNWREHPMGDYDERAARPADYVSGLSTLLVHIPLRNLWWNHIPNWFLEKQRTRLFAFACFFGHTNLAKYLFDEVAEHDREKFLKDIDMECLQKVSQYGDLATVNFLISLNSSYINDSSYWALDGACKRGRVEVVKVLANLFTSTELETGKLKATYGYSVIPRRGYYMEGSEQESDEEFDEDSAGEFDDGGDEDSDSDD
ncbi:hypothetical protein HDU76_003223 [Blyttiomyces sp. JEL0837]|nr:hypothetical protein HDU76_003223 [Blyttiomyces sp. JEL0837]